MVAIYNIDFMVTCGLTGFPQKMPMQYFLVDEHQRLYTPCSGCDNMNGSAACLSCLMLVNKFITKRTIELPPNAYLELNTKKYPF